MDIDCEAAGAVRWKDVQMPRPHPPEFRQRAVELARLREKPVAQIAEDLGISDSCLRNWMARADIDEGRRDGVSSREREELVALRREARTPRLENERLKRAAAHFARENVLPKWSTPSSTGPLVEALDQDRSFILMRVWMSRGVCGAASASGRTRQR